MWLVAGFRFDSQTSDNPPERLFSAHLWGNHGDRVTDTHYAPCRIIALVVRLYRRCANIDVFGTTVQIMKLADNSSTAMFGAFDSDKFS